MGAPKAKTKMTRSNWSKKSRPNTKSHDLKTSQKVTVMNRFGTSDIGKYASTYMSRNTAAVPEVTEVGVKPHPELIVSEDDLSKIDVSRESLNISESNRLFDDDTGHLSDIQLDDKLEKFKKAQDMGHVSMIQVISFDKEYLEEQNMLVNNEVDDSKLRYAVQKSMSSFENQAGFSNLEYVAAIHGNTDHPHVHIAMIETDDFSEGRLAQRDTHDLDIKGKTPAAIEYDKKHHMTNTVERGMLRQSELDYFRQEIDHNISKMNQLSPVVDQHRKQTYATVLQLDALEHAKNNDEFVNKFIETVNVIQNSPIVDSPELDERVENLSKLLLGGTSFDIRDNLQEHKKFFENRQLSNTFQDQLSNSYNNKLTEDQMSEYNRLGLDQSKYTDFVLTPDEYLHKNDVEKDVYNAYSKQYVKFINNPSLVNIDGLELSSDYELDIDSVDYLEIDKDVRNLTNQSVRSMLEDAVEQKLNNKDLNSILRKVITNKSIDKNAESNFDEKMRQVGHQVISVDDSLKESLQNMSEVIIPDSAPNSIKQARTFIKDVQVENMTALMYMSQNEEVDYADKRALVELSELTQRQILGNGDLSKSGQVLCSALSVEFESTGRFNRFHQLSDDERTSLIKYYKLNTTAKMITSKKISQDLENEASFSETEHWQSWRYQLSDLLNDMSEDYQTKLEYIDNVEKVVQEPEIKQQELEAEILLSQEIWRKGIEDGLTAKEIQSKIEESKELSTQDKLSTALAMRVNDLDNQIQVNTREVKVLNDHFNESLDYQANVKVKDILDNEIIHQKLHEQKTVVDIDEFRHTDRVDIEVQRDKIIIGQKEIIRDINFTTDNLSDITQIYDLKAEDAIDVFNIENKMMFSDLSQQSELISEHLTKDVSEEVVQEQVEDKVQNIKHVIDKQKDKVRLR